MKFEQGIPHTPSILQISKNLSKTHLHLHHIYIIYIYKNLSKISPKHIYIHIAAC